MKSNSSWPRFGGRPLVVVAIVLVVALVPSLADKASKSPHFEVLNATDDDLAKGLTEQVGTLHSPNSVWFKSGTA